MPLFRLLGTLRSQPDVTGLPYTERPWFETSIAHPAFPLVRGWLPVGEPGTYVAWMPRAAANARISLDRTQDSESPEHSTPPTRAWVGLTMSTHRWAAAHRGSVTCARPRMQFLQEMGPDCAGTCIGVTPSQTRRGPLGVQLLDAGRAGAIMKGIVMNDPERVEAAGRRWMVSVFGDITRRGSWPSRDRLSPVAVFGDIDLDFRQAGMPAGQVAITAVAPFGNIDVLVPDGVQVDVGGFTLFGSKKIAVGDATTNESAAVVGVRGFSFLGSVKVSS